MEENEVRKGSLGVSWKQSGGGKKEGRESEAGKEAIKLDFFSVTI